LAAFIAGLPQLFVAFPKSFTLGEGCLVLQAVCAYSAHAAIFLNADDCCNADNGNPVAAAQVFAILSKHLLIALGM
jgi:hypothetical protein